MLHTLRGKIMNTRPYSLDKTLSEEGTAAESKSVGDAIAKVTASLNTHKDSTENPHKVTKQQVGLGNVDNTSDYDKPVSKLQADAIAAAMKAGTDAQATANTAVTAAANAQDSAANALTAANNANSVANSKVSKSGDTMTGSLTVPALTVKGTSEYPMLGLEGTGKNRALIYSSTGSGHIVLRNVDTNTGAYENFQIPAASDVNENSAYNILTTKEVVKLPQGGTGAKTSAEAVANLKALSLEYLSGGSFEIAGGADMNSFTNPGTYRAESATIVQSLLNAPPYAGTGFRLIVSILGLSATVLQIAIFNYASGFIFYRVRNSSGNWGGWQKNMSNVLSSYEYGNSLPSTGVTGQVFFLKE